MLRSFESMSDCDIDAAMHRGSRLDLPIVDGVQFLLDKARAAEGRVAHLGCSDYPFTSERLRTRKLLHQKLVEVSECDGIDIDSSGLRILEKQMPEHRFVEQDILESVPPGLVGAYELVIAGEVLEHVDNPGAFLDACRRLLSPSGVLCITVPNAIAPKNGVRALAGVEVVHPDHFAYYSPRTLRRALIAQKLRPTAFGTCFMEADPSGKVFNAMLSIWQKVRSGPVGDGVIATAVSAVDDDLCSLRRSPERLAGPVGRVER